MVFSATLAFERERMNVGTVPVFNENKNVGTVPVFNENNFQ